MNNGTIFYTSTTGTQFDIQDQKLEAFDLDKTKDLGKDEVITLDVQLKREANEERLVSSIRVEKENSKLKKLWKEVIMEEMKDGGSDTISSPFTIAKWPKLD